MAGTGASTTGVAAPTSPADRDRAVRGRGRRIPLSVRFGGTLIVLLALLAIVGPLLWTKDPRMVDVLASLSPPSGSHPMGTDSVGRDVFARFLAGARISLLTGLIITTAGAVMGLIIGLTAASGPRLVDTLLMRSADAILAFPPLVLAMGVSVGLGANLTSAIVGVTITTIPYFGRLVRTEVLRVRSVAFVEAAVALGEPRDVVLRRHVVPHVLPTLYVQAASTFGYAILSVAGLGFVGLGAQPPTPEWGTMLTDGFQSLINGAWWASVFPGLGILAAVTAATTIADGIRDYLDPTWTGA